MISEEVLGLAVKRALISADQAEGLRVLAREAAPPEIPTASVDDEALRFITGFADIFVTIGIALFLGALYFLAATKSDGAAQHATVALGAWLLAEFFTRRRRMALPSIVLLIVFLAAAFETIFLAFPGGQSAGALWPVLGLVPSEGGTAAVAAGLGSVALAVLHYLRFRVPVTIAAGVAALCIAVISGAFRLFPQLSGTGFSALLLICGLLTFALAMRFDLSDPGRETRRTDIAFWLHLLAAPLIVHPLIRGFLLGSEDLTAAGALAILGIFFLLGIAAVIIDRRAMLVSGLVYAGLASGKLIQTLGFSGSSLLTPSVLLILGAFILLISAGWHPLRRALLQLLPAALASRLPHPLAVSST
jgi:hypothetical protein